MGKRLWLRIMLSIAIGVVITLATAWVLPNVTLRRPGVEYQHAPTAVRFDVPGLIVLTRGDGAEITHISAQQTPQFRSSSTMTIKRPDEPGVPDWVTKDLVLDADWLWAREERVGWPARSFRSVSHWRDTNNSAPQYSFVVATTASEFDLFGRTRTIRTQPMWGGLAANIGLWSACLFAIITAAGFVRARIRMARGCCPACGYRLDDGVADRCPECGTERGISPASPTNSEAEARNEAPSTP